MKRYNYDLLKQQAKDLEEVADHYFTTIVDTEEWENALMDFINQAGFFHICVENVLEDERDNLE